LPVQQKVFKLACGHQFHEPCIRGWLMVGKKDMCPQCSEKVDLRRTFTNPWETGSLAWAQILDLVRYLVVWQPILLVSSQLVLYAMGFGS
jgi:RING finger protein 121